ncbi:hypothetical protein EON64_12450, partial [archaeon]
MGAAAGKQFQSDKAKHATAVLTAVQEYEKNHPGEFDGDDYRFDPNLFKRRVLLVAADAKRRGKDIDRSLSQLGDADLEKLRGVVEKHRRDRVAEEKLSHVTPIPFEEEVEEISSSDDKQGEIGGDALDETTSVLSYGDEELPTARDWINDEPDDQDDHEDNEIESSGSLAENKHLTARNGTAGGEVEEDKDVRYYEEPSHSLPSLSEFDPPSSSS